MTLRRRLLPVSALVVAIGASAAGAATAASTGKGGGTTPSKPGGGQPVVKCVVIGKDKKGESGQSNEGSVAGKLGVTEKQLEDALIATKQWIAASGTEPTPEVIAGHVAGLLHLPEAKVAEVLVGDKASKSKVCDDKPKGDKGKGTDAPDWAKMAKDLGVTADQLQKALVDTKIWIGDSGVKPTPDVFLQHVAGLLHLPVDKVTKVLNDGGVFREDPGARKDKDPSAGKDPNTAKKPAK